jgi:transcriptional regulator with XRE-family HTH domain
MYMAKSWDLLRNRLKKALSPHGAVSEFCRRTGFARSGVDRWMHNENIPKLDNLDVIAEGLGVNPWDLIKPESIPQLQLPKPTPEEALEVLTEIVRKVEAMEKSREFVPEDIAKKLHQLDEGDILTAWDMLRAGLDGLMDAKQVRNNKEKKSS